MSPTTPAFCVVCNCRTLTQVRIDKQPIPVANNSFGPPFVRRTKPNHTMSMSPLEELRHSASHVLATAVLRLFPEAKLDIGPPTDSGFYYDIDLEHKFTADDLVKIEAEMKKIAEENQRFDRKEVSREEAIEIIKSRGQERYKLGRLADIPADEKISFYTNGEFRIFAPARTSATRRS